MHNNGTSPLILPDRRLLPDLQPQSGVNIQVGPNTVIMEPFVGCQKMQLALDAQTAMQLGTNLISAATLSQVAGKQAAQPLVVNTDPETPEAQ